MSTLYVTALYVIGKDVGQYFLNILSGNKDFTNKKILNTNTLGFERAFFANSYLQMFVLYYFLPKKQLFLSPEVPEGQKGTKKLRPSSVWGTNEGQNCFFELCLF